MFEKFRSWLNDLSYEFWQLRIMSDALEYGNSSEEVKSQLSANFDNHYKRERNQS